MWGSVAGAASATPTYTATVGVGSNPAGVAVSPDGSTAYVANADSNSVSVIDTATNTVTATIGIGVGASQLVVTPDGSTVYVTKSTAYCPMRRVQLAQLPAD